VKLIDDTITGAVGVSAPIPRDEWLEIAKPTLLFNAKEIKNGTNYRGCLI
jgi:hypothetical protein